MTFYEIDGDTVKLYNWHNPASKYNFEIVLSKVTVPEAYNLGIVLEDARKYFCANYTSTKGDKDLIKGYYAISDEINLEGELTHIHLSVAALELLKQMLTKTRTSLEYNIKSYLSNTKAYLKAADVYSTASAINELMTNKIRLDTITTTLDALDHLLNDKLNDVFLCENNNMYRAILNVLSGDTKSKGKEAFEVKYQYTQLALSKSLVSTTAASAKMYRNLQDKFERGNARRFNHINSFRISKLAEAKKSDAKKELSLNLLYPNLKRDMAFLKERARGKWRHNAINFNWDSMQQAWMDFNDIKCKLMFLGYDELRVARMLSKIGFASPVGQCTITKQWMPTKFLVPVIDFTGAKQMFNVYILYQQLQNGGRRAGVGRYEANEVRDDASDASSKFWREVQLPADLYYQIVMINHSRSALDFLTPRSVIGENVQSYNKDKGYRPTPYLGVELEVERSEVCLENITEPVLDSLGRDFVILKKDGSLRGHNPFEIVTAPATLDCHKEKWASFMADKGLKSNLTSFRSGNCGMHVHISRDAFTGLHLAKFMRFINMEENSKFIAKVAQRSGNRFTTFTNYSAPNMPHAHPLMNAASRIHRRDVPRDVSHYEAVNTANEHTVEVRIFRGNLGKTQFFKNLEFVHALWAYTQQCSIKDLNYKDFLFWLFDPTNNHHKAYANLEKWWVASKMSVSNTPIRKDCPPDKVIKLTEKRKKLNHIRLVMKRKFKTTEKNVGRETREELLASA